MATSLAPREETGRAVGMVQAAQILSAAIGPLAGGWLADAVGIRQTFLATAGLCAVALLLVMRYYREAPRRAGAPATRRGRRDSRTCSRISSRALPPRACSSS